MELLPPLLYLLQDVIEHVRVVVLDWLSEYLIKLSRFRASGRHHYR